MNIQKAVVNTISNVAQEGLKPASKTLNKTQNEVVQVGASSLEALANYSKSLVKEIKPFDKSVLPSRKIDEVFSKSELAPAVGNTVDISPIMDLAIGSRRENYHHWEATGTLTNGSINWIRQQAQWEGLSEEATLAKIADEKDKLIKEVQELKVKANEAIDSLTPTKEDCKVYRSIGRPYDKDYESWWQKMQNLQQGQEVVLDSLPMYVSTDAQAVMGTYGTAGNHILFDIDVPAGSKMTRGFAGYNNSELIMRSDSKFEVLENEKYANDFNVIKLKYLPE